MTNYINDVHEDNISNWPFVKNKQLSTNDAKIIFNFYFNENS